MLPRIGPRPGCVAMSTKVCPALWFSAANIALEKRIERICDFGGSLPPRKPSTRMRRAGPGHLLQHLLHLVRIVGQRLDLILRQHVAEAIALRIRRGGRRVAADRHALGDLLDRQRHLAPVVSPARTRTSGTVRLSKPGNAHGDGVAARPARSAAVATPWPSELTVRHTDVPRRRLGARDDDRRRWESPRRSDPGRRPAACRSGVGLRGRADRRPPATARPASASGTSRVCMIARSLSSRSRSASDRSSG